MKKSLLLINLLLLSMFSIAQSGSETYDGCEGDGYFVDVNGTTYNEANPSGTEVITGGAFDGSDSTVVIDLIYKPNSTGIESYSGCEGDGYTVDVNGTTYNESNPSGTETLVAANGCDSIVTIDLEFLPNSTGTESYDGCEGDGYEVIVNGNTYDEANPSGTETLVAANGCDSIVTIDLIYKSPGTNLVTYEGCEGDGYEVTVNGNTYDEMNPTGMDTISGGAVNGCDSIISISLTYNPAATSTETHSGCVGDGYQVVVNGTTYDQSNPSGIDTLVGAAASGCDSIVTIDLTFDPPLTSVDEIVACESYTWIDGVEYTASNNTATQTLTSVDGCDSIVTLDLTITPTLDLTVNEVINSSNDVVLIAQQSNGSYQWLDCDDNFAPIAGQNNQTFVPSTNGNYAVRISKGGCVDTSSCISVSIVSTTEFSQVEENLTIHPNPSEGVFNVSGYGKTTSNIIVLDALGRQIADVIVTNTSTKIDLSDKKRGVYFFSIIQDDTRSLRKVILK